MIIGQAGLVIAQTRALGGTPGGASTRQAVELPPHSYTGPATPSEPGRQSPAPSATSPSPAPDAGHARSTSERPSKNAAHTARGAPQNRCANAATPATPLPPPRPPPHRGPRSPVRRVSATLARVPTRTLRDRPTFHRPAPVSVPCPQLPARPRSKQFKISDRREWFHVAARCTMSARPATRRRESANAADPCCGARPMVHPTL